MIKILYIIDKLVLAGAQTHLISLLKNLDRGSFEPQVVCLLKGGELIEEIEKLGIEYKILGLSKLNSLKGLWGVFKLYSFIRQQGFDIVHTYLFAANIFGVIAAKLAKTPIIITCRRDTGMLREGKLKHILAYRFTNKWVTKVVCVSEAVKKIVLAKERINLGKLEVIYNGIDIDKFSKSASRQVGELKERLGINGSEYVVGMIANFSWIKGQKDFIDAAKMVLAELPNTKFLLIGDGPLLPSHQSQVTSHQLDNKILFLGKRMDIPELLSIMDISVNASYSEGMSNTILESMAMGVPVVATAVDGNLETVVDGVTGMLVPTRDPQAMAGAIIRILKDRELAIQMGENARKLIKRKSTTQIMVEKIEDLYTEVMELAIQRKKKLTETKVNLWKLMEISGNLWKLIVRLKPEQLISRKRISTNFNKFPLDIRNHQSLLNPRKSAWSSIRENPCLAGRQARQKVAFIMPQFPRYDETFILREILELKNSGMNMLIFSLRQPKDEIVHQESEEFLNSVINLPFILSFKVLFSNFYFLFSHPFKYLGSLFFIISRYLKSPKSLIKALAVFPKTVAFAAICKKEKVRLVHGYWATTPTVSAMIISRLIDIPFSFTGHAHDIYVDTTGLKEKIREAEFVLTCTQDNKRYLLSLMNGQLVPKDVRTNGGMDVPAKRTSQRSERPSEANVPAKRSEQEDKIMVSYHGIDLSKFNGSPKMEDRRAKIDFRSSNFDPRTSNKQPFKILSVGSLLDCKGFDILIDACRILEDEGVDFECIIAGGGPLEKGLRLQVASNQLDEKIKFTGYITQDKLIPIYQNADVFVLPARLEIHWGIPNVVVEAMAAGLPAITTPLPSIPELIKHGENGWIIPEKDPRALAEAIKLLYKDAGLRHEFSIKSKRIIQQKFDIQKNAIKLRGLFTEAIKNGEIITSQSANKNKLLVLAYHRVSDEHPDSYITVSASNFRRQMEFIYSNKYRVIGAEELINDNRRWKSEDGKAKIDFRSSILAPRPKVVITFDDGYKDNYTNAYPILREFGFKATIFLVADRIDKDQDYLTWKEVEAMSQDGIAFGSHTLTHPNLCSLSIADIKKELSASKKILEQKLNKPIEFFCYPRGYFNATIQSLVREAGYRLAFSVIPGENVTGDDPYAIKRIQIGNKDSLWDFRNKIKGRYLPFQKYLYRKNILEVIEESKHG